MGHDSDGKFNNGHANELAIKLDREQHRGGGALVPCYSSMAMALASLGSLLEM